MTAYFWAVIEYFDIAKKTNRRGIKIMRRHFIPEKVKETPTEISNAGKNGTHYVVIMDGSSSMQHIAKETVDGLENYINGLKKDSEGNDKFSLFEFDGLDVNQKVWKTPLDRAEKPLYQPSGMTNLNDAVGSVIMRVSRDLEKLPLENRESVVVCILTDGYENCSNQYSTEDIKNMISVSEECGWGYVFIGANIDAFSANKFGINSNSVINIGGSNSGAYTNLAAKSSRMSKSLRGGMTGEAMYSATAFTDEERDNSV